MASKSPRRGDGSFDLSHSPSHLLRRCVQYANDLFSQAQEYLQAGGNCVQCERSEECHFFELGQALMDRAAAFEAHLRTRN